MDAELTKEKINAEIAKVFVEIEKMRAETAKINLELIKAGLENRWYPAAVGATLMLAFVAVAKLFL